MTPCLCTYHALGAYFCLLPGLLSFGLCGGDGGECLAGWPRGDGMALQVVEVLGVGGLWCPTAKL